MSLLFLLLVSPTVAERVLVQTQIVHRHGDRVPYLAGGIPNDYVDWEELLGLELGQLTGVGVQQSYELGQWLRKRYITEEHQLLNTNFRASEVWVQSTNVDRTLMTAQYVVHGLFEPGTSTSIYNDLTGQPALADGLQTVPIHTQFKQEYLEQAVDICPQYKENVEALYETDLWKDKESSTAGWIWWFNDQTGMQANVKKFYQAYDPIVIQKAHNLLELQSINEGFAEIKKLADWVEWHTKKAGGVLIGGPLAGSILKRQRQVVEHEDWAWWDVPYKYVQYSGHDSTLMSLAVSLEFDRLEKFQEIASYCSAFLFDLYEDSITGNYTVDIIYRDGLTGEITNIETQMSWYDWEMHARTHSFPDTASWCIACNNTAEEIGAAGQCLREVPGYNASAAWPTPAPFTPPPTDPPSPTFQPPSGSPTTSSPTHKPTMQPTPVPGSPTVPPTYPIPTSPPPTIPGQTAQPTVPTPLPTTTLPPTSDGQELQQLRVAMTAKNTTVAVLGVFLALALLALAAVGFLLFRVTRGKKASADYQNMNLGSEGGIQ